jgi:hypothetical protein
MVIIAVSTVQYPQRKFVERADEGFQDTVQSTAQKLAEWARLQWPVQ